MDVVELLRRMVGFDTVNRAISGRDEPEAPLAEYLQEVAQGRGFNTLRVQVPGQTADLLVSCELDPGLPWLLFDSHLDTVSVEGMTIPPFEGAVRDGRLWGRGACDTKGSGAAMFAALCEYAQAEGPNNIMLLYSTDEERDMEGVQAFMASVVHQDRRVTGVVVGEPTRLELVAAHDGAQRYLVVVGGVAAHSADPTQGVSAISAMAELILYLEREYIPGITAAHPLTGKAQCSINIIRGGSAVNIIPDRCEIQVDRRTVPGESPADVTRRLEEHLALFQESHPKVRISMEPITDSPPLSQSDTAGFIGSVQEVLERQGLPGSPVGVKFATHAGYLCRTGWPCVVLGPGDIERAHTKDESIGVDELSRSVDVYLDIMRTC